MAQKVAETLSMVARPDSRALARPPVGAFNAVGVGTGPDGVLTTVAPDPSTRNTGR